jgi:hypothetical protein
MALRIVSSFLMHATRATFPRLRRRSWKLANDSQVYCAVHLLTNHKRYSYCPADNCV